MTAVMFATEIPHNNIIIIASASHFVTLTIGLMIDRGDLQG
jgi:hypothetical protein